MCFNLVHFCIITGGQNNTVIQKKNTKKEVAFLEKSKRLFCIKITIWLNRGRPDSQIESFSIIGNVGNQSYDIFIVNSVSNSASNVLMLLPICYLNTALLFILFFFFLQLNLIFVFILTTYIDFENIYFDS